MGKKAHVRSKAAVAIVAAVAVSFGGLAVAGAAEKTGTTTATTTSVKGKAVGKAPELVEIKKLHQQQLADIKVKLDAIKALRANGDIEGAKAKMDELKTLRETYRKAIEAKRTAFQATHGDNAGAAEAASAKPRS